MASLSRSIPGYLTTIPNLIINNENELKDFIIGADRKVINFDMFEKALIRILPDIKNENIHILFRIMHAFNNSTYYLEEATIQGTEKKILESEIPGKDVSNLLMATGHQCLNGKLSEEFYEKLLHKFYTGDYNPGNMLKDLAKNKIKSPKLFNEYERRWMRFNDTKFHTAVFADGLYAICH